MPAFLRLALLALALLGTAACSEPTQPEDARPNEAFQDLLNALPDESLHAALNELKHFRAGVFESHRHGVERVHHDDPPLASKLIVAAVQDLKKRQTPSNGTTTNNTERPSETPRTTAAIVPMPIETTTDAQGRTTTLSSSVLSVPTASVAVTTTRTNSRGQTEVATETKPAVILSTTDDTGRSIQTTSAVELAPTAGEVQTRTDDAGSTFLTTFTPGGKLISSVVLLTTTGTDGQPSVVTSFTFVDPVATPAQRTVTARPGLQTGAAVRNRGVDAAMMGGVFGGALAFFV